MIARRVRVRGRVQGVSFRAWTRDEASALGVAGWVCNLSDGSVEAHVQGDFSAVEELLRRMHHGPPHARVRELLTDVVEPEDIGGFEVTARAPT